GLELLARKTLEQARSGLAERLIGITGERLGLVADLDQNFSTVSRIGATVQEAALLQAVEQSGDCGRRQPDVLRNGAGGLRAPGNQQRQALPLRRVEAVTLSDLLI